LFSAGWLANLETLKNLEFQKKTENGQNLEEKTLNFRGKKTLKNPEFQHF